MNWEAIGTVAAAVLTLAIFSLLYKENPFYRFAEHLLVGVSAGYYVVHYFYSSIIKKFYVPVFVNRDLWLLPGGLLGLLMLFRLTRRHQWVSRYAIAFYVAAWSGYLIPSVLQERILTQVAGTIPPAPSSTSWLGMLWALVLLVGVVTILIYFFFSAEHKGLLGGASRVGIVFLMVGFGASFGYTIMGRVSLLIGRFQFLF
ncbi:MAG: hypothetical protein DRH04_09905, partial [Deltaproteobacteria bacterium]